MHKKKIFSYFVMCVALFSVFVYGCPIFNIFGMTCPTCGVTHAWIYFFKGNFKEAFSSNFLFLPLTASFLSIIYCDISKRKVGKVEIFMYLLISFVAFIFNIYRILKSV